MKNIVFVCIENSNRSQMAQAFANMYGNAGTQAFSAGSRPSGKVNPRAIAAMKELGYNLEIHRSRALSALPDVEFEYVVTMGCGDACPLVRARHRIDWQIPDPRDMDETAFREVRNLIRDKVKDLITLLNEEK